MDYLPVLFISQQKPLPLLNFQAYCAFPFWYILTPADKKSLWKTPKKSQIPGSLQAIHPISLKSSCFYTTPSMSFTNSDPTALLHTLSNHQLRPISTKAYSPIRRKLYSQLLYKNICYILIIYSIILTTFIINYHSCQHFCFFLRLFFSIT